MYWVIEFYPKTFEKISSVSSLYLLDRGDSFWSPVYLYFFSIILIRIRRMYTFEGLSFQKNQNLWIKMKSADLAERENKSYSFSLFFLCS